MTREEAYRLAMRACEETWNEKTCKQIKEALEQTSWIPVSERLPEDGQSVLFCDIDNDIMVGYHVKGKPDTHFSQDGTYEDMKNVRAWMPLPEPYKAESEEQDERGNDKRTGA